MRNCKRSLSYDATDVLAYVCTVFFMTLFTIEMKFEQNESKVGPKKKRAKNPKTKLNKTKKDNGQWK